MRAISKITEMLIVAVVLLLAHCFGNNQPVVACSWMSAAQKGAQAEKGDKQRADVYPPDSVRTRPAGKNSIAQPGKNSPRPKGKVYVRIGVTLVRGRSASEDQLNDRDIAKVRACLKRQGTECLLWEDMVAERISMNTPISHGTPIQMIIEYLAYQNAAGTKQESGRVGYLYVINRVEYRDGKTSPPRLIYPTRLTFGGHSTVLPGRPVILPGPQELWQITRNRQATQAFETYIIIVSPEPLKDSDGRELQGDNLSESPLMLDEELVANWVRLWGKGIIQPDSEKGIGQLLTQREQNAGGDPTTRTRDTEYMGTGLTQDDPPPQIDFRKALTPGGKMLITVKLLFKDKAVPAASMQ